ncbi:MAG: hypothetical protein D6824_08435, partial [Planctomycetota bacterium]
MLLYRCNGQRPRRRSGPIVSRRRRREDPKEVAMLARLLSPPLLCAAAAAAAVSSAAAQPADLVVVNAAIWTGDAANPQANALAVRDGRFVAVGEEARNFIGPDTRVIDAEGARVVPGLMDTHVHIVSAAVSLG